MTARSERDQAGIPALVTTSTSRPDGLGWPVSFPPGGTGQDPPAAAQVTEGLPDTAIQLFKEMNDARAGLCVWTCHASDVARHAREEAGRRRGLAKKALDAWRTAQPPAPRLRTWLRRPVSGSAVCR